jgi:hypothetical protein
MDMPRGYICRLLHTGSYKYPTVHPLFSKDMAHCLHLIWKAKMVLEGTIDDIISMGPSQEIGLSGISEIIYPTFYNSKK